MTHPEVMTMRRYAEYDPDAVGDGRILTVPPTMRRRQTVDKIRDAVDERRFRVLQREPDGSWTLRWLDDTTGLIGEPDHTSDPIPDGPEPPFGAAYEAATDWALSLDIDVENWQQLGADGGTTTYVDYLRGVIADVAQTPRIGRALVVSIEDDRHTPGLRLVKARERWTASGRLSPPLCTYELPMFRDVEHILDWASEGFGVDRAGWRTVTEGGEYQHD